jgi:hypothetical protein
MHPCPRILDATAAISARQQESAFRKTALFLWIFFTKSNLPVRSRSESTPLTMSKWRAYEAWVAFSLPVSGVLTRRYWFSALYGGVIQRQKKLWIFFTKRKRFHWLFNTLDIGTLPLPKKTAWTLIWTGIYIHWSPENIMIEATEQKASPLHEKAIRAAR